MTEPEESRPRGRICLTCANWDVRIARTDALRESVARCNHPDFRAKTLVVSGSSSCAGWTPYNREASRFRDTDSSG